MCVCVCVCVCARARLRESLKFNFSPDFFGPYGLLREQNFPNKKSSFLCFQYFELDS